MKKKGGEINKSEDAKVKPVNKKIDHNSSAKKTTRQIRSNNANSTEAS